MHSTHFPRHKPFIRRAFVAHLSLLAVLSIPPLADERGPLLPPGAPDLVADPAGIRVEGNKVHVEVANRGSRAAAATTILLSDDPPLQAPATDRPVYPRHPILPGERALVMWPEANGGSRAIKLRWRGTDSWNRFSGSMRLEAADGTPLPPLTVETVGAATDSVWQQQDGWLSWAARTGDQGAGLDLTWPAAAEPAWLVVRNPSLDGVVQLAQTYIGNWWLSRFLANGLTDDEDAEPDDQVVRIALDDPRLAGVSMPPRPEALRLVRPLPALPPGGRTTVVFELQALPAQIFVRLDPEQALAESREGNNTAVYRPRPRPAMLALHTHSSLSEGKASFDNQMDLLSRSGYDAVFWTDHDWRMRNTGFAEVLSFEDAPSGGSWMNMLRLRHPGVEGSALASPRRASHGARSLEMTARVTTGNRGQAALIGWRLRAARSGITRSLAQDLSLAFDIYPDLENPFGSDFTLDLGLSRQPGVQRRLLYRIETVPHSGTPGQVVLPAPLSAEDTAVVTIEPGRWTRIVVPVSRHARALFPEGLDNALTGIRMGLTMHEGEARWNVDAVTLETAVQGEPLMAIQETWAGFYPALFSHVSNEISYYVPHFNAYTDESFLLDYDQVTPSDYVQVAADQTRRRHGAFALAHPLGFSRSYGRDHVEEQLQHRLFAADLVEAGYRFRGGADLADHLAFWDRALALGIPAGGIGVTDAHGPGRGNGFQRDENNFATWVGSFGGSGEVEVDAASRASLVDGLLAGNLVFGDPLLFKGQVQLQVDTRHGPGAVVLGTPQARQAELRGAGLPPGGTLRFIVDGRPAAPVVVDAQGQALARTEITADSRSVRGEVWGPRNEPVVFTNAILLLPSLPPEGLPAARLRALTERGALTGSGRYRIEHLDVSPRGLLLRGSGQSGVLRLEGAGGEPAVVSAVDSGSAVRWSYDRETDVLTLPLAGSGLSLRWSSPAAELARSRWFQLALAAVGLALVLWWFARPRARQA